MSGYVPCGCRDCFDLAISGDDDTSTLCLLCKGAGCVPILAYNERIQFCSTYECQREDAYDLYDADAPIAFWPEEVNGHA